jgi:hypothetical protein
MKNKAKKLRYGERKFGEMLVVHRFDILILRRDLGPSKQAPRFPLRHQSSLINNKKNYKI